uniref:BHLH domain-containing protein n=1 Tax=Cuerna arida TaxID=1464854 RepID=A0A1B6F295_9HEMI
MVSAEEPLENFQVTSAVSNRATDFAKEQDNFAIDFDCGRIEDFLTSSSPMSFLNDNMLSDAAVGVSNSSELLPLSDKRNTLGTKRTRFISCSSTNSNQDSHSWSRAMDFDSIFFNDIMIDEHSLDQNSTMLFEDIQNCQNNQNSANIQSTVTATPLNHSHDHSYVVNSNETHIHIGGESSCRSSIPNEVNSTITEVQIDQLAMTPNSMNMFNLCQFRDNLDPIVQQNPLSNTIDEDQDITQIAVIKTEDGTRVKKRKYVRRKPLAANNTQKRLKGTKAVRKSSLRAHSVDDSDDRVLWMPSPEIATTSTVDLEDWSNMSSSSSFRTKSRPRARTSTAPAIDRQAIIAEVRANFSHMFQDPTLSVDDVETFISKEIKRTLHNRAEKARRDRMACLINNLRQTLPPEMTHGRKLPKKDTLECGVKFLTSLRKDVSDLEAHKAFLNQSLQSLECALGVLGVDPDNVQ